ncbi:MAG: hypothetical protein ACRD1R_14730 [Acidobacteriota bacterium]
MSEFRIDQHVLATVLGGRCKPGDVFKVVEEFLDPQGSVFYRCTLLDGSNSLWFRPWELTGLTGSI